MLITKMSNVVMSACLCIISHHISFNVMECAVYIADTQYNCRMPVTVYRYIVLKC